MLQLDPGEFLDERLPGRDDLRRVVVGRRARDARLLLHGLRYGVLHRELELAERPRLEGNGQGVFAVGQRRDVRADGDHGTQRKRQRLGGGDLVGGQHAAILQRKAQVTQRRVATIDGDPQQPHQFSVAQTVLNGELDARGGVFQAAQGVQFFQEQAWNEHACNLLASIGQSGRKLGLVHPKPHPAEDARLR